MSIETLRQLYELPFFELLARANRLHAEHHDPSYIQICSLISIKTGGCPEDCKYCAQSSRYKTSIQATPLMSFEEVIRAAKEAIECGATRICLGVAQREVRSNTHFEEILRMVRGIKALGVQVCCTLGMLNEEQANRLKEAGLYAYNHNLDTSERYYPSIITTRNYQDRLNTLKIVGETGLSICCGGILGLGETIEDRLSMLLTLSQLPTPPDSVPINLLTPVPGTPMENQPPVAIWELVRLIATTRLTIPKTMIRLSAGRKTLSYEQQALCFAAGANSIHVGKVLLTVGNNTPDSDREMLELFGLTCGSKKSSTSA